MAWWRWAPIGFSVVLFAACGESASMSNDDKSSGAESGSGGVTPTGGSGANGGMGFAASGGSSSGAGPDCSGLAGTTGLPGGLCPSTAPTNASPCTDAGRECAYEDCAGVGRTMARCEGGAWAVETAPCADFVVCSSGFDCAVGAVCVFKPVNGEPYGTCSPNQCLTGPISCDCVQGCGRGCELAPSLAGVTIECAVWPQDCP